MPRDCKLKLFRVLVSTHRTDYLVTNEVEPRDTAAAEQESSVRWTIEPFHRELKQLTGVQAYQCRLTRSQGFLDAYMRHELIKPALVLRESYYENKNNSVN